MTFDFRDILKFTPKSYIIMTDMSREFQAFSLGKRPVRQWIPANHLACIFLKLRNTQSLSPAYKRQKKINRERNFGAEGVVLLVLGVLLQARWLVRVIKDTQQAHGGLGRASYL